MSKPRARVTDGELVPVTDGWSNLLSGIGSQGADPTESSTFSPDARLNEGILQEIYRSDGVGARIIDLPANDSTRGGFTITGEDAEAEAMREALKELEFEQKQNRALRWARLFGGSVMLTLMDDAADLGEPVRPNAINNVTGFRVYDRHQLSWTTTFFGQDPQSPWFGVPERYMIHPHHGEPFTVHRSRLMFYDGRDIPARIRARNDGWGDSELQIVTRSLARYAEAIGGVSSIIRDFVTPVLKMSNLADLIARGQEDKVKKRLEIMGLSRSVLNMFLIDAEREGYEKKASSVAGLNDLFSGVIQADVATTANIPQTKLYGRAPAGENATGESDTRNYYDMVSSIQEDRLSPNTVQALRFIYRSRQGPTQGKVPDFGIKWNPLWQPSAKEQAEIDQLNTQTAVSLVEFLDVDPEGVREWMRNKGLPADPA